MDVTAQHILAAGGAITAIMLAFNANLSTVLNRTGRQRTQSRESKPWTTKERTLLMTTIASGIGLTASIVANLLG